MLGVDVRRGPPGTLRLRHDGGDIGRELSDRLGVVKRDPWVVSGPLHVFFAHDETPSVNHERVRPDLGKDGISHLVVDALNERNERDDRRHGDDISEDR